MKALVTGASSGIGHALAKRIAARGYEVWASARRTPDLEALAREIEGTGGRAQPFTLDVSRPEEAEAKVRDLDRKVGGFDLVVANAGIGGDQRPASKQSLAGCRATIETNYLGALAVMLPVLPSMIERRSGHIVGVTSLAGEITLPAAVDYGTSKCALSFYLASAAPDLEPLGVAVTDVRPGFVKTPLTDKNQFAMPFLVEVDEAARIIDNGIAKRKRVVRFPLPLALGISSGNLLPTSLRNALIRAKRPI